jgi:hypothetical protein
VVLLCGPPLHDLGPADFFSPGGGLDKAFLIAAATVLQRLLSALSSGAQSGRPPAPPFAPLPLPLPLPAASSSS